MRDNTFLASTGGKTSERAFNYTAYAKEGFQQNSIVFSCIRLIYSAATRLSLQFEEDGETIEKDKIPKNLQPVVDLLKLPMENMAYDEWLSQAIVFWLCGGMEFINGVNLGSRTLSNGEVNAKTASELQLLRPDLVEIKLDGGRITGYLFDGTRLIEPECMMYVRFPDSMSIWQGMPPMRAAATSIDKSNSSTKWGAKLFENSATPSGMVSFSLPNVEKDDIDALMAQFQNDYAGPANAGKTIFLEADKMSYQRFGLSPKDMAISEMDLNTLRMISNAFGVPSQMLGDPDTSKYSNYQEAQKDLYQNNVIPLVKNFYSELTRFIMPKYGIDNINIVPGWSHIEFLNDDKNDRTNRLSISDWMTDNEKRLADGMSIIKGDPAADQLKAAPAAFFSRNPVKQTHQMLDHVSPHSMFRTQESRDALVDDQEKNREPKEQELRAAVLEFWNQQEALVLDWIGGVYSGVDILEKHVDKQDINLLFQTNNQNVKLFNELEPLELSFITDFGNEAIALAGSDVLFNIERPGIQRFVTAGITERSQIINNTTADQLNTILQRGVSEGVGVPEIKIRIQERFTEMTRGRALSIARTETGIAQSKATIEGYSQASVKLHEWVSARDSLVRDSHAQVDGEVRELGETFSNGLVAPLIGTDPAEVINCRCVSAPLNPGDEPI